MAAVQGLLKKHEAFEADLSIHLGYCDEIVTIGQVLIREENHHEDKIVQRCDQVCYYFVLLKKYFHDVQNLLSKQLLSKIHDLKVLASQRKPSLLDNSAYLQFIWKADVVDSWIADKEAHVISSDFGHDLSSVQILLTKQVSFIV